MIKLITRLEERESYDVNYIRIAAGVKAYGLSRPFLTVWQTGDTLICRTDGYITVCGEDFDPQEVRNFLSVIGVKGIICSVDAADKLGFPYAEYKVMKSTLGTAAAADFSPKTDEVYDILSLGADGDITLPPRDAFMADLSHRVRHGTALACTFKGTACVVPYITDCAGLICGVSAGNARGGGFAGICVAAAVKKVGKPCFVICKDSITNFYKKYGFCECGRNAEIIFNK